ncbi:MAG TPA: AI-2E family transporter [Candidatus Paceibacterota bacterium]
MHSSNIQGYTLFGLLALVSVLTFFIFKPFLTPLALAAIFGVVLYPVHRFFLRHVSRSQSLAALATVVLATLVLLAPISLVTILVIGEAQQTYLSLTQGPGLVNAQGAILYIGSVLEPYAPGSVLLAQNIATDMNVYATQGLQWILAHAGVAFSSILGIGLSLFIFFIALFVFLKNGPAIREGLLRLSPLNDADDERIFNRLELTVNSVVRGSLLVSLVQGLVASVGYVIFGLPNPILWGLVTSLAALVPGVGTALVMAPAIGFLLISGQTVSAIGLLVWGVAAVGLIDNFLGPVLMGRGVHLPPLVILLAVLGGLAFFGPVGIFLGPLTVSLLIALFTLYADSGKKQT